MPASYVRVDHGMVWTPRQNDVLRRSRYGACLVKASDVDRYV